MLTVAARLEFDRFGQRLVEEFDTVEEAISFAVAQEDMGNIYATRLHEGAGEVFEGEALRRLLSG